MGVEGRRSRVAEERGNVPTETASSEEGVEGRGKEEGKRGGWRAKEGREKEVKKRWTSGDLKYMAALSRPYLSASRASDVQLLLHFMRRSLQAQTRQALSHPSHYAD